VLCLHGYLTPWWYGLADEIAISEYADVFHSDPEGGFVELAGL